VANWYGTARSNHVRLKDPQAVRLLLAARAPEVELHESCSDPGRFAFLVGGLSDNGGWPGVCPLTADGKEEDDADPIGFDDLIAEHLVEGEVLILMEVGAEKRRYVTGRAHALRVKDGRRQDLVLSIEDIYALVERRWKVKPTEAAY
jgi:hypothetical protein